MGASHIWGAAANAQVSYSYDDADRLVQITGPEGAQTTIACDLLRRKKNMSEPDMGAWTYSYDSLVNAGFYSRTVWCARVSAR